MKLLGLWFKPIPGLTEVRVLSNDIAVMGGVQVMSLVG